MSRIPQAGALWCAEERGAFERPALEIVPDPPRVERRYKLEEVVDAMSLLALYRLKERLEKRG